MAVRVDQSPYFDDFDSSKKFQKILFKPGVAVQVREMNQLQSILKDQIKKFGDNVFKEGSIVIPGENSFDTNYSYAKVSVANYSTVVDLLKNSGNVAVGQTSSVEATIDMFVEPNETDPSTFYLKYTKSSSTSPIFVVGETLSIKNLAGDTFATASVTETGVGSVFSTSAGVYYIKGNFVYVEAQDLLVSKYTSVIDGIIGFDIDEVAITSNEDSSLFDNAIGSPNETAPGADRLVINLTLAKYDVAPSEFVELAVFDNGNLKKLAKGPSYNVLNDVLAKRTYDESGNYVVEDFGIQVREHLKVDNNKGLYADGDESLFAVGVETGRAYVRGYEVENLSTTYIEVEKARDTQTINNSSFSLTLGSFIKVNTLAGIPLLSSHGSINFYDGANQTGSIIGTAKTRAIRDNGTDYDLFVFDIRNASGDTDTSFFGSVQSCGNATVTANITDTTIYDTGVNSYLYPLPVKNVKTLLQDGLSDTSFTKLTTFSDTLSASGAATITSPNASSVFITQTSQYCIVHFTDDDSVLEVSGSVALGGTPTGSTITLDLGVGYANRPFVIQLALAVQNGSHKTKTVEEFTLTDVAVTSGIVDLTYADVFEIVSIVDGSANDVSSQFDLNSNRKQRFYDISYLQQNTNSNIPTVTVVAKRFVHSTSGEYFSVDSYGSVDYKDIPKDIINGVETSLADVIDFRSVINSGGTFDIVMPTPLPQSLCRVDLDYYLPRIDKLYVDANGSFNISKGTPAIDPSAPSDVDGTMTLCSLSIPAYTQSASEITIDKVNNRRYTMKDIGDIENRVSVIEEFIGLNDLEKSTADLQIIDANTGLSRFKNGFVVDQFVDHSIGEYTDAGYHVAIDPIEGKLVPEFEVNSLDIESVTASNVVINNGIATLAFTETVFAEQTQTNTTTVCNDAAVFRFNGILKADKPVDTWYSKNIAFDTTVSKDNISNLEQTWKSWEINWLGYSANKPLENSRVVNDKYVSNNVVPFIRSNVITLTASGLAPSSRVYCFFDNEDVSSLCKPVGGSYGDPLVCDTNGQVVFDLLVSDTAFQFRTGSKVINVIDNITNDKTIALSYADCLYTASGSIEKRKQGSISTRPNRKSDLNKTTTWHNPIAQSFVVSEVGGVFVTSVDLYFATKDDVSGVTVELREMNTGLPTDNVLHGSIVHINASNISLNGARTQFVFDNPIYLQEGNEYCVAIKTNSDKYSVYTAEIGQKDAGVYVSKQPFVGSLFKTQNGSWIENVNVDMKFTLNKAVFNTSGTLNTQTSDLERVNLTTPFTTTSGSASVSVFYRNHGFVIGDTIVIQDSGTANGILFNGTFTVASVVNYNEFTFTAGSNATISGVASVSCSINKSIQCHVLEPNFVNIKLPSTDLGYTITGITSKSFDGSETQGLSVELNNIVNQYANTLKQPIKVIDANKINSVFNFSTTNTNISPVLDLLGSSLVCVQNKVNESGYASYISKIASVKDSAIGLVTYIDILNPSSASVDVQYRVGNSDEEVQSATFVSLTSNTDVFISSTEYSTQEFEVNDLNGFTHYQVRIVLNSSSDVLVPACKKLKVIALGT